MKALTLTQPWASLVASGAKRFETRSWSTSYRGPIAIHAAKGFPPDAQALCDTEPFFEALYPDFGIESEANKGIAIDECGFDLMEARINFHRLPLGAIVATATLRAVFRMGSLFAPCIADLCTVEKVPMYPESDFGDFSYGRFAWILEDVKALDVPIPAKGALGLWEWAP